jgi:uncharacterized protein YutE (UPF0331/DUF86 family)
MDFRETVRNEIQNVLHELDFVKTLVAKHADTALDDVEIRAAALSLSTIYSGIEKTMLHVLRDRHGLRPEGPNWHTELLDLAGQKSLLSDDVRNELKSFLAFRHFVRHAYSFELDPAMIGRILDRAPDVVERFANEIRQAYLDTESQ